MFSVEPIKVRSRLDAEAYTPQDQEICISITNPRQSVAHLEGWDTILRLGFHDCEHHMGMFTEMSYDDAVRVISFFKHHGVHSPMTVHCEYGASRSVAVGLFLATWSRRPLSLTVDVLRPNKLVLRKLRQAALVQAFKWLDWRLAWVSLVGPLKLRHCVLPADLADS